MINLKLCSSLIALSLVLSTGVYFMPSANCVAKAASVSDNSEFSEKDRYISKLNEALSISSSDYSADSYSLFLDRLAPYNKSLIIEMDSESYSDIEYRTLYDGIEYAESFLVADTSHSYLSDLEKLINYGNSLVKDDYTDESFTAFKTKFDSLASGNYSLEKAKAAEEDGYGGKTIYTSYIEKQYIPCFNLLKSRDCCSVTLVDPNTGITVSSDSDVIPQDAELVVTAYDSTDWPWLTLNSNSFTNIPRLCSQYVYYNVAIYGSDGKRINISSPYTITYPISDDFDMSQLTYQLYTNEIGSGSIAKIKKDIDNKTISVTFRQTSMSKANGSAMLFKNAISNVDPLTLEDGIYNVKANLTASADATRASMSNEAIIHDAYLTKLGDDINIYVNFVPIYVIAPDQPSYCGGLWSEKGKQRDSQYYEDSEVVYSYYTNEDGTIRDNDIYNGVTQIPCPKTIKLHLERDSFNEYGGYTLAVSSPAMAALNNLDFSEIEKYWDELTAIMMISNPTYLGTLDQASSYLPTYDITALQREYEYANILADDNIYTDESWADVQALLDTETTTEDKKCVTGYSDTTELTARIAEYQSATAALVVDENKKIADGRYLVPAHMIKTDRASDSMSENAINHNVVVDVKDGKATVQVEFKGMAIDDKFGYLEKLSYFNAGYEYNGFGAPVGEVTEATVINKYDVIDEYSGKNPPHYLEFPLVDGKGAEWIPLQVFVPVMEAVSTGSGTQSVLMHLDWENKVPAGKIAEYTGNTLSLKDDFGLNFFFNFGEQTLNDAGAKVKFTLPDGSVKEYVISEIADADKTANGYKFSANVAAKEMTAPVKVQVILSNGETSEVFSCSVKEYADKLLASSTNESEIALVKSILNYGGYAQEFFGYNKTALANADLTDAEKTLGDVTIANTKRERVEDEDDGINFYGSSLSLNTKIDLKAYFTLEDGAKISDYTFKIGSTELTPVESGNKYYVTIPDITSRDIDERSAIEIANKSGEGELSVKTGPYAYIYKALSKSSDEKLQSLMKALYFYSQAAEKYNA
ncbi:NEAT domain-containing protein [Ruminococcus flavefaciens]|uniref:NEAT domain-containing protein n=1 Tax=Ruminococcus flavefaciens TaxID=1265 RepID=UPI0009E7EB7A|nr:NEAT domain-containing protein [Ruminococcus flavefaciens]